jgi:EAL domain-containing protein (putative c-di-GMP-specific phosphodiesterase class I)
VVLPNEKAENVADILRFADTALRSAKGSANGAQCLFEAIQLKDANERLSLEQGIRHGLENNDFMLHYQPQVDIYGQPIGAEVLARWHSALGNIPPGKFIPVAEETGLILKLGSWVIDEACRQLSAWDSEGLNFPGRISINVSAWQFSQPNFNGEINHILDRHNIHPSRINLEITETVLMQNIHETSSKLKKLRNEGYHISLDDFGTGYSSLAYLRDLPLDCLKIDKSFVDTIEPGRSEPLIESMISIGRHMDLDIIAEGVETDAQYQELLKMRCKGYQGYLFAKPLPAVKFAEWLRRSTDSNNNLKYIHQV